ncbi:MAG: hypothetical protein EA377_06490 [Phycisphaerales bacterium]|nr:MAG: hypothetical protein EA377_06490 [Phycisphaerales bacterium]
MTTAETGENTHDVLHMRDGRVLTGQIKEETGDRIVFRYVDRTINISTPLTLNRADILKIERDVPTESEPAEDRPQPRETDRDRDSERDRDRDRSRTRGLTEGDPDDDSLISFSVVPMRGQMGTDIHPSAYREVVEAIKRDRPDVVIWKLDCSHLDDLMISFADPTEQGMAHLLEEYRELVTMLQQELSDFRQVMWVQDSVGVSSLIAMAFPEMYMAPDANLVGLEQIFSMAAGWQDEDVRAKMVAAWVNIANSFIIRGGHQSVLGEAMIRPDRYLSGRWRGREVRWSLNLDGEFIVSSSRSRTANFNAKMAEDFAISKGTAETLDDLALLMGYREYRVLEDKAPLLVERHIEDWRSAYDRVVDLNREIQRHMRLAGEEDPIRHLSGARQNVRQIRGMMRRYPALENRLMVVHGMSRLALQVQEEQLTEQIRSLQQGGGRGGGGGGGFGGGGGGGR